MKLITGTGRANELNVFFYRFSSGPPAGPSPTTPVFTPPQTANPQLTTDPFLPVTSAPPPTPTSTEESSPVTVTPGQMRRQLEKVNQGKAAGPDRVNPWTWTEAGRDTGAMENILHSAGAQEAHPIWPQQLQTFALT